MHIFEKNRGVKASDVTRTTCTIYKENAIGESTGGKLFSHLKEVHFDMNDSVLSGKPYNFDKDRLML